jgi:hypothetical protein
MRNWQKLNLQGNPDLMKHSSVLGSGDIGLSKSSRYGSAYDEDSGEPKGVIEVAGDLRPDGHFVEPSPAKGEGTRRPLSVTIVPRSFRALSCAFLIQFLITPGA